MDNFRNVLLYRTTMAMFRKMLEEGLISSEEYAEIDDRIAGKYSLSLSVIYR